MGDYEHGNTRLQQMWEELISDEDDIPSELGDVYLFDDYEPSLSEDSTPSQRSIPKKLKIDMKTIKSMIDTSRFTSIQLKFTNDSIIIISFIYILNHL
ncbi:hypothetical protein AVEN_35773-1 [Araneus ventricosus]|uniref:Uncharacterized protein n=1 Tax=Araneus ventricosus TaxID=182803 RepID=A0A4Y2NUP7_ARAVE|nr:hypothetical protein AVEN_35773-1 [Araneus ventricosus]